MHKIYLSSSIICADILNLKEELDFLQINNFDYIHYDIFDYDICDDFSFGYYSLNKITRETYIKSDYHIMSKQWTSFISKLNFKVDDMVSVHLAYTENPIKRFKEFKEKYPNVELTVMINPNEGLEDIKYIEPFVDNVGFMSVNPGEIGKKFIPETLDKIKEYIKIKSPNIKKIIIDGNVNSSNIPSLLDAGVNYLVLGSSGLYKGNKQENVDIIRNQIREWRRNR